MGRQQFVKDYLTFTRKERIGLLLIVFAIMIVIILPKTIRNKQSQQEPIADTSWISAVRKLEIKDSQSKEKITRRLEFADNDRVYQFDRSTGQGSSVPVLFYFDPNTLDEAGWRKLGLKNKTIHTILNYLTKGGHFYKPEDLKKIYGLHPADYLRLERFIKIEGPVPGNFYGADPKKENDTKVISPGFIDINAADTVAFISLPGIGSKLAGRIVNFRDKLGGFYSVDQVAETFGLPDSTFQKIKQFLKVETNAVKKININTATVDELKSHPYIKGSIAGPIVAYRNEHGLFSTIEDIKKVVAVTNDVYNKISPYLTLQ